MRASEANAITRRRALKIQKTRFWFYTILAVLAVLLRVEGWLHVSYEHAALCYVIAAASCALSYAIAWWEVDRRLGLDLNVLWIAADMVTVTLAVHYSGDYESPWYVFYLCNTLGVAFSIGPRAAYGVGAINAVLYPALIRYSGGTSAQVYVALARLLLLDACVVFGLQGIGELQRKRQLISQLRKEESQKVSELTRLTQALDERTQELHDANLRIRSADRQKSQFLANMSHELRTPLNSIIGFSEILLERLAGRVDAKEGKFLNNIHSSGSHLLGLINDILDLSKIEAGKMELHAEPFELMPLVEGVLAIMKGMAAERRIHFEVDADGPLPELEADPGKLKQILYNLLSNAVKFSPEGGAVTVRLRVVSLEGALEIAVIDRGIGIDPKDHQAVFQEFHQVDAGSSREFQGTGLGLALVKKFVKLHRGTIALESKLGEGAKFIVRLPLSFTGMGEITQTGTYPGLVKKAGDARPMVVVVEDDATAFELIERELLRAQFRPLRAHTGEEALRLARTLRPQAITLDLVLPGMSGFDVLKKLKEDAATREIPVIIVSLVENRELGLALGADDYFVKPVDAAQLARRVRECLPGEKRARRVLVIDDDPTVHALLDATLLASNGYQLEHARSGPDGIAQAATAAPDLIVLDLMMDGMDGFEVATRIKADAATAHVPILVLTNKELSSEDRARLRGKIGGLIKKSGTSTAGLIDALTDLLSRHGAEAVRG
jgi:signal transduction histidine kinase/DNA-binding response OmpR family regulator